MIHKLIKTDNYLLVVDDSEIIEDCYAIHYHPTGELELVSHDHKYGCKLCKKIISHLPLNGSPILEGVDLLPPYSRHQEEGIEELAQEWYDKGELTSAYSFKAGYNKAREKYKYTEDDVWKAIVISKSPNEYGDYLTKNDIIQSLHQYPTQFECEMVGVIEHKDGLVTNQYEIPKTITTSQGVQWVGKYK